MSKQNWLSDRRFAAFVASIMALSVVLSGLFVATPANAAAPDPRVTTSLSLSAAGTGYCTPEQLAQNGGTCPTQTFVNEANGFVPGANSAGGGGCRFR